MIELNDFIRLYQIQANNVINNVILDKMVETFNGMPTYELKTRFDVDINKEKFVLWIKQMLEIETFTTEQIEDLKIKNLVAKKDEQIKSLQQKLDNLYSDISYIVERR